MALRGSGVGNGILCHQGELPLAQRVVALHPQAKGPRTARGVIKPYCLRCSRAQETQSGT